MFTQPQSQSSSINSTSSSYKDKKAPVDCVFVCLLSSRCVLVVVTGSLSFITIHYHSLSFIIAPLTLVFIAYGVNGLWLLLVLLSSNSDRDDCCAFA